MIQNGVIFRDQVQQFNRRVNGRGQIQKMYSTARYLCITIRYPGQTRYLYLGRGGGYEGIWEGEDAPASELRLVDRFLEYIRKHLSSAVIETIEAHSHDRLLVIPYLKGGHVNRFMIFWSGRRSYFLNRYFDFESEREMLFCSWLGAIPVTDDLLSLFVPLGLRDLHDPAIPHSVEPIHALLTLERQEAIARPLEKRKLKSLETKVRRIEEDLKRIQGWRDIKARLQDPNLDLSHEREVKWNGWRIRLQDLQGHYKKVERIYNKIKDLQNGERIVEQRLKTVANELDEWRQRPPEIVLSGRSAISPVWKEDKHRSVMTTEKKTEYALMSMVAEGQRLTWGVGLSAQGNDALRSEWARDEDWWFHIEGGHSAHVILKGHDSWPSPLCLGLAAALLADYSKREGEWIPLLFTQVKYLKGVRGTPGKVIFRKEKRQLVQKNPDWKKILV